MSHHLFGTRPAVVDPVWDWGSQGNVPEIYWPSGNRFELYAGYRFLDNAVSDECYRVTFYNTDAQAPLIDDKDCSHSITVICETVICSGKS